MVKRMIMRSDRLRISVPGVDVDVATPQQLMLDERVLSAQIFFSGFLPRSGSVTETVTVTIPNLGFIPYVSVFALTSAYGISKPSSYFNIGSGNVAPHLEIFQPNSTTLQFYWPSYSTVIGVYYQIYRVPRN